MARGRLAIRAFVVLRERGWKGLYRALIKRLFKGPLWRSYSQEAMILASNLDFSISDLEASQKALQSFRDHSTVQSITWFLPDFHNPFYGGIYTILRFAAHLEATKGVCNQFVIVGSMSEKQIARLIAQAFPNLSGTFVRRIQTYEQLGQVPGTDAAIATLWNTAYFLLRFNSTKRKFYFLQDYEPIFYPAGSTYAQVEATYQFGFYGIANTPSIKKIYEEQYGGAAECFVPAVDTQVFHPAERPKKVSSHPYTVFFYGRPEHPRNGFELGAAALIKLKKRLGDRVRIVAAGANWHPDDYNLQGVVENLGILSYSQTAELYRNYQAGLIMMFTRHPSYLPLELMASGCLVVSNYNPATTWLLKDRENCLLSKASGSCLAETLERALLDEQARTRITTNAIGQVQTGYSDWEGEIEKVYRFICNPDNANLV
jgi:O-antigen biosynthesis protein